MRKSQQTIRQKGHPRSLSLVVILVIGIISIFLLIVMDRIRLKQREHYYFADVLMDMQIHLASAHLWIEEVIHGDREDYEESMRKIEDSKQLIKTIVSRGKIEGGLADQWMEDPSFRTQVEDILNLITEFEIIAIDRINNREIAEIGSSLDDRFDKIFASIMTRARSLEFEIEEMQKIDSINSRRLFIAVIIVWGLALTGLSVTIWRQEHHHREIDDALINLMEQLEAQRAELEMHREQLVEIVEERTAELTVANRDLLREISERKKTEEALRASEKQYRTLVETMSEGLAMLNNKGSITYVNDAMCKILGYSENELLGQNWIIYVRETHRDRYEEQMDRACRGNSGNFELDLVRKDCRKVNSVISQEPIFDEKANFLGSITVVSDITEIHTIRAEVMRTEQLASIGELAAGVAHEINNPINGIINYARILFKKSDVGSQEREIVSRVLKESRRIAEIVKGLLIYSRSGSGGKIPVQLRELLFDTMHLINSQMKKEGIELRYSIPDDVPEIIVNRQQIQQVFLNVINNSRYALNQKYPDVHEDKIIEISCEKTVFDGNDYLRVTITDRGVGIPQENIQKVMEPFFSTKPSGEGTGLGLSICRNIISDHGGNISIESSNEEFTFVAIDLPARLEG